MEEHITKEDLRQFRLLLLNDIENLIASKKQGYTSKIEEDPEWIRSKSIRQILNISPATLQNLRISGKIEFRKVLGSYYYKKEDVLTLFNK
ncbi:Helix-turn-helix domain-containing protein [Paenimyroides ummariense]|uniref:Helix-turn-helix domain-containing protein n=1 Tax=Paenimyroides ummariense TaxID=913024 RepID=A0A1I5EKR9_9FLAO|nr:helix-turn-helix domain-containing protein [Paenimyroides ummariense]SFO12069.1 Helix-turn-helix domain-containing protein [Paenimyroides ummariense]